MQYQWYPGHMSRTKRQMQEDIRVIDVVLELIDARIPYSSKNPEMDNLAKNKSRILLFNKEDMADPVATEQWKRYYEKRGYFTALLNAKNGTGVKSVNALIQTACKEKTERDRRRGILNRPVRAMIVGIPNVGKSTFINSFAGKACTKTGNKPGVTKGKQWIRMNKTVELLDTPGILWPKFEDQNVGKRIAFIGSINDTILNQMELAYELCQFLSKRYPDRLNEKYGVSELSDPVIQIEQIAEKRACRKKGGDLDIERAAYLLLDDFRNAKLGRITLELPEDFPAEQPPSVPASKIVKPEET